MWEFVVYFCCCGFFSFPFIFHLFVVFVYFVFVVVVIFYCCYYNMFLDFCQTAHIHSERSYRSDRLSSAHWQRQRFSQHTQQILLIVFKANISFWRRVFVYASVRTTKCISSLCVFFKRRTEKRFQFRNLILFL